ncbi:MAG: PilT/PilU family type 4a pilus ATPase [Candidatus Aegiribacteria sp.]|nr:PilT/PilU family type 4a pilus ATPase [Candidatus Aegiribacteria sp.]
MATIDNLLRILQKKDGSDLHISPENSPLVRISGDLFPIGDNKITSNQSMMMLYEIMNDSQKEEFEATYDIDFAYEVPSMDARFRVNIFLGRRGISAVLRMIPNKILTVQQLGLSPIILDFTRYSKGLVLVTGPTGSGKSTTLAAMIDHINKTRKEHIITIEDPIEFVHVSQGCLVNQREVGSHTRSFKAALRASLREDPDIILVGEMRDLETIELAITAAETGHLVFGTLHTSSAAKTVDRIINVFPTNKQEQIRTILAESIIGVVAQQLLRTIDGKRCAALEILFVNAAVSNLIREGKTFQIPSVIQTGKSKGMQLLDQDLEALVTARKISVEEAYKYAVDKRLFPLGAEGLEYR